MSVKACFLNVERYVIPIFKDDGVEGFGFVMETECYSRGVSKKIWGVTYIVFRVSPGKTIVNQLFENFDLLCLGILNYFCKRNCCVILSLAG